MTEKPKMVSKAELLSQKKQRERPRRNPKAKSDRILWTTRIAAELYYSALAGRPGKR